jgi:polysaccharide export outer membrane protein
MMGIDMSKDLLHHVSRLASGLMLVFGCGLLSACSSGSMSMPLGEGVQSGQAAYAAMDVTKARTAGSDYKIGALDTIDVNVYQEPELSAKAIEVDATGNVSLPLIGSVKANGKTSSQLSSDIATALAQHYLKNPLVTVTVASSASQKVTVGGEVIGPGVFEIKGPTSLLQTLALAKGPTKAAKLNQVVVFRNINGQRMGAVFDIRAIGAGRVADPQILGNDIIIVGFSRARSLWNDILSTIPVLNVFRPIIL